MIDDSIRYFSTNQAIFGPDLEARVREGSLETVGLAEAIMTGQAPDGGLFMPTHFPQIDHRVIARMEGMEYWEVFSEVMSEFFEGVLSRNTLDEISQEAYRGYNGFEPILEPIYNKDMKIGVDSGPTFERDTIMRLDEGPTFAFKDYAAQVLFRTIDALIKEEPQSEIEYRQKLRDIELLTFITSTSGDTGSAMGKAIYGMGKMWMAILHSSRIGDEVSELQAKQMSTIGGNVYSIWLDTDFDGCNRIAQDLQKDKDLEFMHMNTANSSNIGRLLPQIAYYFYAYSRVADKLGEIVTFSVPSGNFGDAVAGLFAQQMGLPIKLIIGVNENDVFSRFYETGVYQPADFTRSSPSNSMNINWPSNMRRLFQLYGGILIEGRDPENPDKKIVDSGSIMADLNLMKQVIVGSYSISDSDTHAAISRFYEEHHHFFQGLHSTIEPHTAVAWEATRRYREATGNLGKIVTISTAHPGKFSESLIDKGINIIYPREIARLFTQPHGHHLTLEPKYNLVKDAIVELYHQELVKVK